ncbi:conserved hypothetical protein [Ricinus communis]|uniref:Uncharacterized protein n=1 Tax=Ricinus communis TaxID=3988 RepID=B9SJD5_RICCO|nr:conserved hypothetical protein [Ricinus communis]
MIYQLICTLDGTPKIQGGDTSVPVPGRRLSSALVLASDLETAIPPSSILPNLVVLGIEVCLK